MKLIMTLLLRNEEDILKENIEYHLNQGVDFIVATNNLSTDGTEDILRQYEAKGLLHYISEDKDNHHQGRWVTKMARLAAKKFNADWIINNDADEFWWPTNHANLKDAFTNIDTSYNVIEASRRNFVYVKSNEINTSFYKHMIFKESQSLNPLGLPLPPKQAHIANENIIVSDGNHSIQGLEVQNINTRDIEIFHFPIRTEKQFINKIKNGGAALERNEELPEYIGNTWRSLYKELCTHGHLSSYLESQVFTKDRLNSGELIEDKRLMKFLENTLKPNPAKLDS